MNQDSLKKEIAKAEGVRAEARENYEKNPDNYSAQLLLLSIENHLSDLHRKLDELTGKK